VAGEMAVEAAEEQEDLEKENPPLTVTQEIL
jgi:hypothetical protein